MHEIYVLEEVIVNPYIKCHYICSQMKMDLDACTWWKLNAAWYQGNLFKNFCTKNLYSCILNFFVLTSRKIIIFIPHPNFQIGTLKTLIWATIKFCVFCYFPTFFMIFREHKIKRFLFFKSFVNINFRDFALDFKFDSSSVSFWSQI